MSKERIKKPSFYSIKTSMVLYFLLLISMVILCVSIISYYYTIRDIEHISITYTERLIAELTGSIDSYISNIKSMTTVIGENKDVQQLMAFYDGYRGTPVESEQQESLKQLRENAATHLGVVAKTRSEIVNIAVISKYYDVLLSDPQKKVNPYSEFNVTDWFLKPLSYKNEIVVSPPHVQNIAANEYQWVISISKAIIDSRTGEVNGVMVIDLNFYAIENICETAQLGSTGYIYIIDEQQDVIYHPQQQLIYAGIKVDPIAEIFQMNAPFLRTPDNKIYTCSKSSLTKWTTVGVVNSNELIRNRLQIVNFYFALGSICLVFATCAAFALSSSMTKPIKQLELTMHLVEEGHLNMRANTDIPNEIGHLAKTFNSMVAKIKMLMENAVETEQEKRRAEIKALQAQINPHFLNNTLETIIWMAASGKTDEVAEVTAALAGLMRTSISKGTQLVTLRNEIANISSYLTIQQIRYSDKLTYKIEVDPSFMNNTVPKLILQPIVENALYHGIKPTDSGGNIRIGALLNDDMLILTVSDSGTGMSEAQIEHIFDEKESDGHGIGITNVNNRIKLCFGENYGLHYFSVPGIGTRVEIWLPVIRREDYEDA